jgi:amidophosphoribosyltransferase
MGGFFGVVSRQDCVPDLFYGTDYHSHLGTRRGGLAVLNEGRITRFIHDITNAQFRSKFEDDIAKLQGLSGIGVISDYEDQPLLISSHLGRYAIVTVGVIQNLEQIAANLLNKRMVHFSEMSGNEINPTELIATLINQEESFAAGINAVREQIEGSCSIMLLTEQGIYAARDRFGRTSVVVGRGEQGHAVTMETCALPNLGYSAVRELGPNETVLITPDGIEQKNPPGDVMRICAFLWVYYGYPASSYEGINVESSRYRCGAALADEDTFQADCVAGIPDSGTSHAIGYADRSGLRYCRPFVKYTPTWPRSFMPQQQNIRELVARMKLIPIRELIDGRRILFCDDSVVRGTQLKDTLQRVFEYGAREIHMRPACPPLVFGCKYLNFSRSRSEYDLAARRAIKLLDGNGDSRLEDYADDTSDKYHAMVACIGERMGVTSLRYQKLEDMISAIGIARDKVCTYCWNGRE